MDNNSLGGALASDKVHRMLGGLWDDDWATGNTSRGGGMFNQTPVRITEAHPLEGSL